MTNDIGKEYKNFSFYQPCNTACSDGANEICHEYFVRVKAKNEEEALEKLKIRSNVEFISFKDFIK